MRMHLDICKKYNMPRENELSRPAQGGDPKIQ